MPRRTVRPPVLLAVAAALSLAACGDGGARADVADPGPQSTVAASSGASGASVASGAAAPGSPSGGTVTTGVPDADLLPVDHFLVASERGVELVGPDGSVESLTSMPASRAYDDGAGGVVFQDPRGTAQGAPSPAVRWLPPGGGDPVTVLPQGLGTGGVDLLDAGVVAGTPVAIVAVYEDGNSTSRDYRGSVQRVSLPDGARTRIVLQNTFESGFTGATLGTDQVVINGFSEAANSADVYRVDGMRGALRANPLIGGGCGDRADCPYAVAVSPDGTTLAWAAEGTVLTAPADGSRGPSTTALTVPAQRNGLLLDVTSRYVLLTAGLGGTEPPSSSTARSVDLRSGRVADVAVSGHASLTTGRDG